MVGLTPGTVEHYRVCVACGRERTDAPSFCDVDAVEREVSARCDAIGAALAWLRDQGHTLPPVGDESVEFLAYVNGKYAGRFYRAPTPLDHVWEMRERAPRVRMKAGE